MLAAFATEDGPSVLVISIRAGGRGLNLPAANHVFHFDRWWNPAVEQQATDRVHRFGQRKHVFVHSLICTGTLEERIDQLLDSKRELAEKVIAGRSEDWLGDLDLGAIRAAVELSRRTRGGGAHERSRRDRGPWARLLASGGRRRRGLGGRRARPRARARRGRRERSTSTAGTLARRRRGLHGHDRRRAGAAAHLDGDDALRPRQPPLEEAVEGRAQSVHLEHLMTVDWERAARAARAELGRACTCDDGGLRQHVAALAYVVADAHRPRSVAAAALARLRAEDESQAADAAAEPEPAARSTFDGDAVARRALCRRPAPLRPLPAGAVLKRLGPSGLQLRNDDLAVVLQRAYASFAASAG